MKWSESPLFTIGTNPSYFTVVSLLIFLAVGIYTRKVPNRRLYIMAAATIPPFVGLLALAFLPNTDHHKWVKWFCYLITVPFVLALFLSWTLSMIDRWHLVLSNVADALPVPSNVAGRTKKTIISSAT